jgi:AcrR family transcriptional regulator
MMMQSLTPLPAQRTRRRQEDRTALSYERMTRAAIDLLVEKGVAGTTLAAVGEGAGYSRGLVSHRFGSKAGLLAHVVKSLNHEWRGRLNAAVAGRRGLAAILRAINALEVFVAEEPRGLRVMYMLGFQSIDPAAEYRANVAAVHEAQRRDLEEWVRQGQQDGAIRPGVDHALAAAMLAASIAGLVFHWLVTPGLPIGELHRQLRRDVKRILGKQRS